VVVANIPPHDNLGG